MMWARWPKEPRGHQFEYGGRAILELRLGPVQLTRALAVADIKDEILLGDDILQRDEEGPMDILHSEGVITFKGHRIPLQTIGRQKHPVQVQTRNAVLLHGMTECIIDGYID